MPDFSKLASGTLLGKILRAPLQFIPKSAVVTVRSGVNRGFKWTVGSSTHGCWLGHYESEYHDALRRFVQPGMKVFDVGANVGFYTLAFARLAGAGGHVWAFEPLPANVRHLARHIELNDLRNVRLIQAAVADKSGTARFSPAPDRSMGQLSAAGEIEVPVVTLDEISRGFDIDGPDFIKCDVEGAEARVLAGASGILARGKAVFMIELHGRDEERDCGLLLERHGYVLTYPNGELISGGAAVGDRILALPPRRSRTS